MKLANVEEILINKIHQIYKSEHKKTIILSYVPNESYDGSEMRMALESLQEKNFITIGDFHANGVDVEIEVMPKFINHVEKICE